MKNRRYINRLIFRAVATAAIFLPAFLSCTDRIDIELRTGEEHLVIYGYITNRQGPQEISVTRSSPFFSTGLPEGVHGALITVYSSEGDTYTFTETPEANGTYVSDIEFAGVPGMEYRLEAEVDFDGDYGHFTASDVMPLPVRGDRLKLSWSRFFKNTVDMVVWGELPEGQKTNIVLKAKVGDRMVNDSLSSFFMRNEKYINSKILDSLTIFMLDQEAECNKIEAGDEVSLTAILVSKDYYDFLLHARKEVRQAPPLFDGPAANVPSNIRQSGGGKVPLVGYFTAYSETTVSTLATEEFMNTPHK